MLTNKFNFKGGEIKKLNQTIKSFFKQKKEKKMKKFSFFIVTLFFLVTTMSIAQTIVEPTTPNALKEAVNNANAGDVLLLEYGGVFPFDGSAKVDTNITIMAYEKNPGDAQTLHKPLIVPLPDATGSYSKRMFDIKDDLTIVNVEINGNHGDGTNSRLPFNVRANDVTLIVDNCVIGDFYYASIRTDNRAALIEVTNTLFLADRHMDQIDVGRTIELRGKGAGKVVLQNNTFCNATSMWFHNEKWAAAAAPIDTLIIDHCTFIHQMGQQPAFDIRSVKNFTFTNNVVTNAMMLGSDRYSGRIITWAGGYLDSNRVTVLGPYSTVAFVIVDVDTFQTQANFHNNNIFTEPAVFDTLFQTGSGRMSKAAMFTNDFKRIIDTTAASFEEQLSFARAPQTPFAMITEFVHKVDTVSVIDDENVWLAEITNTMEFVNYWDLDMSYGTSAQSYTAAEDGFPLGDLNWYPDKKAEWLLTAVEPEEGSMPSKFTLEQNYPNPFNPTTNIKFSITENSFVTLKVYNILGQEVATLVNKEMAKGTYTMKFDAKNLTSGLYIYKLQAGNYSSSKKMMLLK